MYLLIGVLLVLLLICLQPVQKFMNKCDELEIIELDSGLPGPCLGIIAGVHGNETAGPFTLIQMLENRDPRLRPARGKIILIPRANQCGLNNNSRLHPWTLYDLNRKFNEYGGTNDKSDSIAKALDSCDLILDFHEGWGWHSQTKGGWGPVSLGSTIFGTSHPLATSVAAKAVAKLNEEIDPKKRFIQLYNESCEIKSTLSCYYEKKGKAQLVIETSGQNNVQPMVVRSEQIIKVIQVAKNELGI